MLVYTKNCGDYFMNAFISVSSRTGIPGDYITDADYISSAIAKAGYDLVIGVAIDEGMPGKVLGNFNDNNRQMSLITLRQYDENPEKFYYVGFEYVQDTFLRTKMIYEKSDILVLMPGGTGSTAEIFAFLEQLRTDKCGKPLVIYNKNGHYNHLLALISGFISKGFNNNSIYGYFHIFDNADELINFVTDYKKQFDSRKAL